MDLETLRHFYRLNQLAFVVIDAQERFAHNLSDGKIVSSTIIRAKNTLTELGVLTYLVFMKEGLSGHNKAWGGAY